MSIIKYEAKIGGMHCTACALNIEDQLQALAGIQKVSVNYASGKLHLEYDDSLVSLSDIKKRVEQTGYSILENDSEENKSEKSKLIFILPISFGLFFLMLLELLLGHIEIMYMEELLFIFSTITMFWIGQPFLKGIWRFLTGKGADMDTLVGIGTLTAYLYSTVILLIETLQVELPLESALYYEALIVVIGFVILGKHLESNSRKNTGDAIQSLIKLQAKSAIVERDGQEIEIATEDIALGDILIIKPGSQIPTDGIITEGEAVIDESMITGEYLPVPKSVSEEVIGGTINQQGYLKIRATKVGRETMLYRIIQLVEEAQSSKAPIQKLVDKISRVFVPTVLSLAVLSFLIWAISGNIPYGISSFVATLVIACPCALGLATPTAIIVGVGKAAKLGILIKDAEKLQKLSSVSCVVFDKTGTLTLGRPTISDIFSKNDENKMLQIAYSLASKSQHPLSLAIANEAEQKKLTKLMVQDFVNVDGKGLTGKINKKRYYLGSENYMKDLNIKSSFQIKSSNSSTVMLSDEKKVLGVMYISDELKSEALITIKKLQDLNIQTVLLSGDTKKNVEDIAKRLNIQKIYSEILPTDKAKIIGDLKKTHKVAMVGDGINDAPALALADAGIAMATGTEIAIKTSDITLLGGNISKIPSAIILSKQIIKTIRENLFWAFIYNTLGIPIAMGVLFPIWGILLNPAFAGIAMSLSSISVVLNSLRLKISKLSDEI